MQRGWVAFAGNEDCARKTAARLLDPAPVSTPFRRLNDDDRRLCPHHYAATRLPLHQASPLPGWCYVSEEWYAREIEYAVSQGLAMRGARRADPEPRRLLLIELLASRLIVVRDEKARCACIRRSAGIAEQCSRRSRALSRFRLPVSQLDVFALPANCEHAGLAAADGRRRGVLAGRLQR